MTPSAARSSPLDLSRLSDGEIPGLTVNCGGALAEAASVCLEHNNHANQVQLHIAGDFDEVLTVQRLPCTEQMRNTHADLWDAAEDGACGIAIALSARLLGQVVVRRAWKGRDKGFDYWLGESGTLDSPPFQEARRLEVSGILDGDESALKRRTRIKIDQVTDSSSALPGLACVVSFRTPKANFVGVTN